MAKLINLIKAAQFQIIEGSEFHSSACGLNARIAQFKSSRFDVRLSVIFDFKDEEVFQAVLYLPSETVDFGDVNDVFTGTPFRWLNPLFASKIRQSYYAKGDDPRFTPEGVFYTDCEVFEDFLDKVSSSFEAGSCDTSVLMPLNLSSAQESMLGRIPVGTSIQEFITRKIEERMAFLSQEHKDKWSLVFSMLAQAGIKASIDIENAPIAENNVQEIYTWLMGLDKKEIHLLYSDKETDHGVVSILSIPTENQAPLHFYYYYKSF